MLLTLSSYLNFRSYFTISPLLYSIILIFLFKFGLDKISCLDIMNFKWIPFESKFAKIGFSKVTQIVLMELVTELKSPFWVISHFPPNFNNIFMKWNLRYLKGGYVMYFPTPHVIILRVHGKIYSMNCSWWYISH